MILSAKQIMKKIECKDISITPYDEKKLNPNSYDLSLSDKLMISSQQIFDVKKPPVFDEILISDDGIILTPDKIYLASTKEYTITKGAVPILFGKSSLSRLGLSIHCTGGFGDNGFEGNWTLALSCVVPIKIYAGMKICQIVYFETGDNEKLYNSIKYQGSKGIVESKFYKEFEK
ncbi:MAG: dCTP deaminase [Firmicutes bacterium]|nr:dCTP deaminase [Bacillota bacterium]